MPLQYVPPEEAFEVRIQCTEEQIQQHCYAAPENDRRDFDHRGGLQIPVYHVYKDNRADYALAYWYTFDEAEDEDNNESAILPHNFLQEALDRGLVRIENTKLITVGGE